MILPRKPTSRVQQLNSFFTTEALGPHYWGVYKTSSIRLKQKCGGFNFVFEGEGLRRLYYDTNKNSLECERVADSIERGLNEAELNFIISIQGKLFSGYFEKHFCEQRSIFHIYQHSKLDSKPLNIEIPQFCEVKIFSALRGRNIAHFSYFGDRSNQFFSIQYLRFLRPIETDLEFQEGGLSYKIPRGANGVILMIPISTQIQPVCLSQFSIVELIQSYPYFKTRGLDFQFLNKRSHEAYQKLMKIKRRVKYQAIEGLDSEIFVDSSRRSQRQVSERNQVSLLTDHFLSQLGKLYITLDECPAKNLALFYLAQFNSLKEMDEALSPGRFVTALAKRLSKDSNKALLGILEQEIYFIHSKAEELGTSLKQFYEGVTLKVEENLIEAPSRDVGYESENSSQQGFKTYLRRHHRKQKHLTQIFRSGLRFPPSKNEVTLQFTQQLSSTEDLAIFETKAVQIFVERRWHDSRWFFILESLFLLGGLLNIFLHSSFFRTPGSLVPLLLIQVWNCSIQVIELRKKRSAYLYDLWNWFDVLRFFFSFIYFIVAIVDSPSNPVKPVFLTLLTLFQSVKVFSIFSLFKSTRVLLRIVIEIVKDMIPFFLFIFATTLIVTLLFTSATIEQNLEKRTYSKLLLHVFLLNFEDFNYDSYTPVQEGVFILAVIAAPLVLLNMLIAIMSDTFDRVKEEQGRRDFQELSSLVYKYEIVSAKMCCWRKKNQSKSWKYIYYSSEVKQEGDEIRQHWQGRIKGIKLQLDRMQLKNEDWQKRMEVEQKEISEWQKTLEEQERRNRAWQKEIGSQLREQNERQAEVNHRIEESLKQLKAEFKQQSNQIQ